MKRIIIATACFALALTSCAQTKQEEQAVTAPVSNTKPNYENIITDEVNPELDKYHDFITPAEAQDYCNQIAAGKTESEIVSQAHGNVQLAARQRVRIANAKLCTEPRFEQMDGVWNGSMFDVLKADAAPPSSTPVPVKTTAVSTQAAKPSSGGGNDYGLTSIYVKTLADSGVNISSTDYASVSSKVCDSYDAGGDLAAAQGVVSAEIGLSGWQATKVVQASVLHKCGDYVSQTY